MGYTTTFSGEMTITPPVPIELSIVITNFCSERHEDNFGGLSIWCDWELSHDGTEIEWNGAEKSYDMPEWLVYLIKHYLAPNGHTVNGRMHASGEEQGDTWQLVCNDNVVGVISSELYS